ncbi:MAG: DMT family transporter [Deltaproteobacteria bacterium]|nr:DMT family transporter [Deltaproteobacteria bacterium]
MPRWRLVLATLFLYLLWSNSFVAMSYVLGSERAAARLGWMGLTQARFLPVTAIGAAWLLLARRDWVPALWAIRGRLLVAGLLAVPGYSLSLYWGIEQGIPAPVASLITAVSPLALLLLGAAFLGEPLTRRKLTGIVVSGLGLLLVARGRAGSGVQIDAYAPILVATLAPLSWSLVTVLGKPVTRELPADVWTAGYLVAGGLPLALLWPWTGAEVLALDARGWGAVLYLSLACTLLGFVLWSWLVVHLPASSAGFTVFLNPPMTLASQLLLAAVFPATFAFAPRPLELVGAAVVLAGMGVALGTLRRAEVATAR